MTSRPPERYPDPKEFDEGLYKTLRMLPDGKTLDTAWVRSRIWDGATDTNIPKNGVIRGMQANMFLLEVSGEQETRTFLVKRVVPSELPGKASEDIWREFVKSVRSEIDFYSIILEPEHATIRNLFPQVYYSAGTPKELDVRPQETAFIIIMENLSPNHYQTPMMNFDQAKLVMTSLANLHAHFWNKVQDEERGGFWVLQRRLKHQEVEVADETWRRFLDRFPQLRDQVQESNLEDLGRLIKEMAPCLDHVVEQGACTRIHGDAKGWNLFFGKDGSEEKILFIDLQWTGRGHPLQDVAYALTTTLSPESLQRMDDLVDFYIQVLQDELSKIGEILPPGLRDSYNQVWLDYARVVITGLWKNLNQTSIESNKSKVGPSMINRSWEHVLFITRRISRLLNT